MKLRQLERQCACLPLLPGIFYLFSLNDHPTNGISFKLQYWTPFFPSPSVMKTNSLKFPEDQSVKSTVATSFVNLAVTVSAAEQWQPWLCLTLFESTQDCFVLFQQISAGHKGQAIPGLLNVTALSSTAPPCVPARPYTDPGLKSPCLVTVSCNSSSTSAFQIFIKWKSHRFGFC